MRWGIGSERGERTGKGEEREEKERKERGGGRERERKESEQKEGGQRKQRREGRRPFLSGSLPAPFASRGWKRGRKGG